MRDDPPRSCQACLKNAADENATIWSAYQQLETYQAELPSLFAFNEVLVVSDVVVKLRTSPGAVPPKAYPTARK